MTLQSRQPWVRCVVTTGPANLFYFLWLCGPASHYLSFASLNDGLRSQTSESTVNQIEAIDFLTSFTWLDFCAQAPTVWIRRCHLSWKIFPGVTARRSTKSKATSIHCLPMWIKNFYHIIMKENYRLEFQFLLSFVFHISWFVFDRTKYVVDFLWCNFSYRN